MQQIPLFLPLRPKAAALCAALGFLVVAPPLAAAESELLIELNKLEDTDEGCRSLFVFDNATGHELNRFQVDLILFDQEGVYARQVMLDMAPLSEDKKSWPHSCCPTSSAPRSAASWSTTCRSARTARVRSSIA